jgi:hypothetical protein
LIGISKSTAFSIQLESFFSHALPKMPSYPAYYQVFLFVTAKFNYLYKSLHCVFIAWKKKQELSRCGGTVVIRWFWQQIISCFFLFFFFCAAWIWGLFFKSIHWDFLFHSRWPCSITSHSKGICLQCARKRLALPILDFSCCKITVA